MKDVALKVGKNPSLSVLGENLGYTLSVELDFDFDFMTWDGYCQFCKKDIGECKIHPEDEIVIKDGEFTIKLKSPGQCGNCGKEFTKLVWDNKKEIKIASN